MRPMRLFLLAAIVLVGLVLPVFGLGGLNGQAQEYTGEVITVSSLKQLEARLENARGPITIGLAPGHYEALRLRDLRVPADTIITSQSNEKRAVLAGLVLDDVTGLTVTNLDIRPGDTGPVRGSRYALLVLNSKAVRIEKVSVVGKDGPADRRYVAGVMLRQSQDVHFLRSYIAGFRHGIAMLEVSDTVIELNELERLQTDAIRGGGVDRLRIAFNVMTDFSPAEKDHPDGIQLWSTNQPKPGRDIEIVGNLVARGKGGATQGIFIRDTHRQMPFEGIRIRGNLILGSRYNGITVAGAKDVLVEDNRVVAESDRKSWIRLTRIEGYASRGNEAMQFIYKDVEGEDFAPQNRVIEPREEAAPELIGAWLEKQSGFGSYRGPVLARLLESGR
jgi:hypothetical protein